MKHTQNANLRCKKCFEGCSFQIAKLDIMKLFWKLNPNKEMQQWIAKFTAERKIVASFCNVVIVAIEIGLGSTSVVVVYDRRICLSQRKCFYPIEREIIERLYSLKKQSVWGHCCFLINSVTFKGEDLVPISKEHFLDGWGKGNFIDRNVALAHNHHNMPKETQPTYK